MDVQMISYRVSSPLTVGGHTRAKLASNLALSECYHSILRLLIPLIVHNDALSLSLRCLCSLLSSPDINNPTSPPPAPVLRICTMIPPISRRRRSLGSLATTLLLLASTSCLLPAQAQNLTASQLDAVKQRLAEGAQQSWELGTRAQALIELDTPSYSVLTTDVTLPPPTSSPPGSLGEVWSIVQAVIANRSLVTASGPQPLISADGAAGDPASLGVAVLLANWTGLAPPSISPVPVVSSSASSSSISSAPSSNSSRSSEPTATSSSVTPTPTVFATPTAVPYADAASSQLSYLLTVVQRTSDGAISHRADQLQLWSDFVYMVPPFLTYYGVLTNNETLATMGYDQCRLYRQYLQDASAGGLWKHIVLGNNTDPGHWSTGTSLKWLHSVNSVF